MPVVVFAAVKAGEVFIAGTAVLTGLSGEGEGGAKSGMAEGFLRLTAII